MTRPSSEAIEAAGRRLAQMHADCAAMTPRQQAEAAHTPGGPSVDELERRIQQQRSTASLQRSA